MAAELDGLEVLIVDGDVEVQRGLGEALTTLGMHPIVLGRSERARVLVHEKYFPVVIVDLDTPSPGAGLELCRTIVAESPTSSIFVLTARKSFEAAVEAFRAGATDVIVKEPDQVEYLKRRLVETHGRARRATHDGALVADALALHEQFLQRLMETSRRVAELGGAGAAAVADAECSVLLVEGPQGGWLRKPLMAHAATRPTYRVRTIGSGGEALDLAGSARMAILLVADALPDLPGSMVVSAWKRQSPDTITVLYSPPGATTTGRADIVDGNRTIPLLPTFSGAPELLARLDELRDAALQTTHERRYLASFREENYELLRRYAELRARLEQTKKK